jgi:hypothetical protein
LLGSQNRMGRSLTQPRLLLKPGRNDRFGSTRDRALRLQRIPDVRCASISDQSFVAPRLVATGQEPQHSSAEIGRGFDLLGYYFCPAGPRAAYFLLQTQTLLASNSMLPSNWRYR